VRDIEKGEEITYDYRMFHENKWRGDEYYSKFSCRCGAPACEGEIRFIGPRHRPGKKLTADWAKKIAASLRLIRKVRQPLFGEMRKSNNSYILRILSKPVKTAGR
jgi:hypothetical protein